MWTNENRPKYNRDHLRYPSDLTDDEWAHVEPFIPPPKPGGGKRRTDMRAVMNAVMYILSTGCQWRYLPKDFPPRSTVHNYFVWWHCDGTLDSIHDALYVECRDKACSASIWMEAWRRSGWPFWRSRRGDDCSAATTTQAIFSGCGL